MATFPPEFPQTKRDQPLIAMGVVMAVLLIALLALPFLIRHRASPRHTITSTTTGSTTRVIAR